VIFINRLIEAQDARLLENENHIFFVRCIAVEAFLVLRDWLTACPAESEQPGANSTASII
jgi:hypothetical protein